MSSGKPRWPAAPASVPCPLGKICPSCPLGGYPARRWRDGCWTSTPRSCPSVQPDRYDRYAQLALLATKEAVADSGLRIERENPHRVGVIMGAGMGGMLIGEEEFAKVYMSNRPHRVHPNFIPMITLNSASGIIAMTFRAKGPNLTISTACSSSAHAIGLSLAAIRAGQADVVITGGAEASLTPLAFAGFCALRALSTAYNDQPTRASRPFERARDGFVMGKAPRPSSSSRSTTPSSARRRSTRRSRATRRPARPSTWSIPKEDGSEIGDDDVDGAARCRDEAVRRGLYQCPCDVHAHRRPRGGHGHPHGLQEAGRPARRQCHQVADRPLRSARRGRSVASPASWRCAPVSCTPP